MSQGLCFFASNRNTLGLEPSVSFPEKCQLLIHFCLYKLEHAFSKKRYIARCPPLHALLGELFDKEKSPATAGDFSAVFAAFLLGLGTLRAALQAVSRLSSFYCHPLLSLQRLWWSGSFAHDVASLSSRFFKISKPSLVLGANRAASYASASQSA